MPSVSCVDCAQRALTRRGRAVGDRTIVVLLARVERLVSGIGTRLVPRLEVPDRDAGVRGRAAAVPGNRLRRPSEFVIERLDEAVEITLGDVRRCEVLLPRRLRRAHAVGVVAHGVEDALPAAAATRRTPRATTPAARSVTSTKELGDGSALALVAVTHSTHDSGRETLLDPDDRNSKLTPRACLRACARSAREVEAAGIEPASADAPTERLQA